MSKRIRWTLLRDWYKPTAQGERARKLLGEMVNDNLGQTGAVGEEVATDKDDAATKNGTP